MVAIVTDRASTAMAQSASGVGAVPLPSFKDVDYPDRTMLGLSGFRSYFDALVALDRLKCAGFPSYRLAFLVRCDRRWQRPLPTLSSRQSSNPDADCMLKGIASYVAHPQQIDLPNTGTVVAGGRLSLIASSAGRFSDPLLETFMTLGLSETAAEFYCDRVDRGNCIVGIEGSNRTLPEAERALRSCQTVHWQVYEIILDEFPLARPVSCGLGLRLAGQF